MDRFMAKLLILIGIICLLQAATKPILWFAGERTTGMISHVERGVSKTGALWVDYSFTTRDKQTVTGSAMAGGVNSTILRRQVRIAYLPLCPAVNMPASAGYAAVIFGGWTFAGLICLVIGKIIGNVKRKTHKNRGVDCG